MTALTAPGPRPASPVPSPASSPVSSLSSSPVTSPASSSAAIGARRQQTALPTGRTAAALT
ncbi:hypothetical protein [Kitasatospora mediocidica]|uniref:hypothetical protein n=1 Tax=Kitasatospora mediocidica TaxID=58352 RepID=UPI0012F785C5|nr:hypothetical protein [Kitasatospora mediocidica]